MYVEFLTVARWFKDIRPALIKGNFKNSARPTCYVFDATPAALWAAKLCGILDDIHVEQIDFRYEQVRDGQGLSIALRILYQDAKQFQGLVVDDPVFQEFVKKLDGYGRSTLYLKKASMYAYDFYGTKKYSEHWHALTLVQTARWHALRLKNTVRPIVLYINERVWGHALDIYAKAYGIELKTQGALTLKCWQWAAFKNKLAKISIKRLKAMVRHKAYQWKVRSGQIQPKFYFSTNTPRLMTEFWGQLNVNDPRLHSDVLFVNDRGLRARDVLLAVNSSIDPIDAKKLTLLKSYDMAAVAMTPQSCAVDPACVPVFDRMPVSSGASLPLEAALDSYNRSKEYWKAFFERYNIKLLTTWNKYAVDHIALGDALREEGGISTVYQRAYEPGPCPQTATGADIIFGFSPKGYDIEKNSGSDFKYHIAIGYIGDYRFESLREGAKNIRKDLQSRGVKHIIAFFDENTIDDGRWFTPHQAAQENYGFWLNKLLTTADLGLVLKPKKPNNLKARLGPVAPLLEEALATGRCYLFDGGSYFGSFPPVAAALAADLAIHDTLSAGTAGLESALAGVPTLLIDLEGFRSSPLYGLGQDVVFQDWDDAWHACQEHFRDPAKRPLGDWSMHLNEFDPFCDGKAALRMSQYLQRLLEGIKASKKPDDIMADAAAHYAKLWGKDKVHRYAR